MHRTESPACKAPSPDQRMWSSQEEKDDSPRSPPQPNSRHWGGAGDLDLMCLDVVLRLLSSGKPQSGQPDASSRQDLGPRSHQLQVQQCSDERKHLAKAVSSELLASWFGRQPKRKPESRLQREPPSEPPNLGPSGPMRPLAASILLKPHAAPLPLIPLDSPHHSSKHTIELPTKASSQSLLDKPDPGQTNEDDQVQEGAQAQTNQEAHQQRCGIQPPLGHQVHHRPRKDLWRRWNRDHSPTWKISPKVIPSKGNCQTS